MLAQGSVYYSTVEEYLGGIRNAIESFQCFFKLIVVIVAQGGHPGFDFLRQRSQLWA